MAKEEDRLDRKKRVVRRPQFRRRVCCSGADPPIPLQIAMDRLVLFRATVDCFFAVVLKRFICFEWRFFHSVVGLFDSPLYVCEKSD